MGGGRSCEIKKDWKSQFEEVKTRYKKGHHIAIGEIGIFFFSSRRRHTRWTGDWSSDVCSSDLHRRFRTRRADLLTRGDVVGYHGRIDTAWALSLERLS